MTQARQSLGQRGEELAARTLEQRGYTILARNYRTPVGELDIVARDRQHLLFVEVKTRRTAASASRRRRSAPTSNGRFCAPPNGAWRTPVTPICSSASMSSQSWLAVIQGAASPAVQGGEG